ncbi:GNAT family N-acetyltransferase [uncultured Pontibacter sp.]|uniref:GNAT family N-acetyltransferase n=1 Tax=uncultured Pontibacter sp. TaxID=453356 RepID=UPI00262A7106|nr:GNAT family N-acetyltransferase [uncultured Pontibacter sp.]
MNTQGLDVLIGEEVFTLLSDEDFQQDWDRLYEACPWGTVFQSRNFVACWYRTYQGAYLPVLVRAVQEGQLTGLLTLALPQGGGQLVGAGHFEAEYQCWLSAEAEGESFITTALTELQRRLPGHAVHLRFLPPGAPMSWAEADPRWRAQCVVQPARRPLMDMAAPDLPKMFRKTEFKNKLNRLRRIGEVRLERVTDAAAFSAMLKELAVQYDFRQGAMFNKNRFRENPLKAVFLQELFQLGLLHATVLKVNEEVIAAIAAVISKDWVHLGGINIHTPLYANYYSPGFVHFLMLGQHLSEEGVAVFDLTPGGDSYKERMATNHDYVHELVVSNKLSFQLKKRLKKGLHDRLIKSGLRPMSVELAIRKNIYLFKGKTKAFLNSGLSLLLFKVREGEKKHYRILADDIKRSESCASVEVRYNNLNDLLDYDGRGVWQTRWEFLGESMRRFESGERSYTWAEGGRLLACAWLGRAPVGGPAPEGAPVLRGIYCHPAGRGRLAGFLAAAVACQDGGELYATAREAYTSQALEAIGFTLVN